MDRRKMLTGAIALGCAMAAILGSAATALGPDTARTDSTAAVVAGNNAFAFDLYHRLALESGNVFFSPYSVSCALAMTYAGARGETAQQMAQALHFGPSATLNPALASLMRTLDGTGKSYQLTTANALWGQSGYDFRKDFLNITNAYYGAGFRTVDFVNEGQRERTRLTINKWVETRTAGKIKELIAPNILTARTRLVLTNAIYFKANWGSQFSPSNTQPMRFNVSPASSVEVPMMKQTATFGYVGNEAAQVLEMPYVGDDLSMVIILPQPGVELADIEAALNADQTWLSRLGKREVQVFLPRFKLRKAAGLNEKLQELGMTDAFDESKADFSGMTPSPAQLFISNVVHEAFLEVNEAGTEAAAATAVVMGFKGISIKVDTPPVFRADRPFFFLIRDVRSGSILFMGRLLDPLS